MTDDSAEEPKIIIDEDWKTQVLREKEELKRKKESAAAAGETAAPTGPAADESSSPDDASEPQLPPPPPASFPLIVTGLATQAMAALGQIPGDDGQMLPANLDYARHFIDSIGVLEEKTKGNLTAEESSYLQETLHQLRMLFVSANQDASK